MLDLIVVFEYDVIGLCEPQGVYFVLLVVVQVEGTIRRGDWGLAEVHDAVRVPPCLFRRWLDVCWGV